MLKYYRVVSLLCIFVLVLSCSNDPSSSSSLSSSPYSSSLSSYSSISSSSSISFSSSSSSYSSVSSISSSSSSSVNPAAAFYGSWYCYKYKGSSGEVNYSLDNSPSIYNFKSDGTVDWTYRTFEGKTTNETVTWSISSGGIITIKQEVYSYGFINSSQFILALNIGSYILYYYYQKY